MPAGRTAARCRSACDAAWRSQPCSLLQNHTERKSRTMHEVELFIQDMAIIMLIAGIVTVVFNKLKQPVVLGYIVAGVIIGPHARPMT
jgi:hypothetical protein